MKPAPRVAHGDAPPGGRLGQAEHALGHAGVFEHVDQRLAAGLAQGVGRRHGGLALELVGHHLDLQTSATELAGRQASVGHQARFAATGMPTEGPAQGRRLAPAWRRTSSGWLTAPRAAASSVWSAES